MTAIKDLPKGENSRVRRPLCRCECGNTTRIIKSNWGRTFSCGCYVHENRSRWASKHGLSQTVTYRMWDSAKAESKKLHIPFGLDLSDIPAIPDVCPITRLKLNQNQIPHGYSLNNPRLDRIDKNQGYVKGNIRIVSVKARQPDQHGRPSWRFED